MATHEIREEAAMGNVTARLLYNQRETIPLVLPKSAATTTEKSGARELPESCISAILSFTTPQDVCRLAAVSKVFRSASYDDSLWNKFVPQKCHQLLRRAVVPLAYSSKRELYFLLCDSILIDAGTKRFWVERSTAKIGYMLSARQLNIVYGEDQRYCHWLSRHDSRFGEVAELLSICWLKVTGGIDCRLLSVNTVYRVVFVLKFGEHSCGWSERPIKFSVTTAKGDQMELEQLLMEGEGEMKRINAGGWMEVVAGEFSVEDIDDEYSSLIKFGMEEEKLNWWKGGFLIDGVTIEPKVT